MPKSIEKIKQINKKYNLLKSIVAFILFLFIIFFSYMMIFSRTTSIDNLRSRLSHETVIYDYQNNEASKLSLQKGEYVSLDNINTDVKDAVLSIEDKNFYKEPGFSVKSIFRSGMYGLSNKIFRTNFVAGGGSTITQQLAKNAFLSQEHSLNRKIKELFLSIEIEKKYEKDEILEMYLNNSYFGNNVWGIYDASKYYFNKLPSDLNKSESAMLAGMLQAPNIWNPENNYDLAINRRNVVLNSMFKDEKISKEEFNQLKSSEVDVYALSQDNKNYNYPWFMDSVIQEAIDDYGLSEKDVLNGGYQIYTDLDQHDQINLEKDYKNNYLFPEDDQSSTIVLDAKTGTVTSQIGGRGEHVFRGFNRATQAKRQPGSIIKPIDVYSPAIESGYNYESELPNTPRSFGEEGYAPHNANNYVSEDVPMYLAVANSYNVPAVWLLDKMGVNKGIEYSEKFMLPISKNDKNLSIALGGLTEGVTLKDISQAYTAFANNGVISEAHYITKINNSDGKEIQRKQNLERKRIIGEETAKEMTSIMLGTYQYGTGVAAKPAGYQVAGKTGTTEDVLNNNIVNASKDQWAVAYTPDLVIASWQGFDKDEDGQYLSLGIESSLGPLFKKQSEQIIQNSPRTKFDVSSSGDEVDEQMSYDTQKNILDKTKDITENIFDKSKDVFSGMFNKTKDLISNFGN